MATYDGKDHVNDTEKVAHITPQNNNDVDHQQNHLHRSLKSRHLQMIAIGGAIGAGLFVGSGGALATGGPGSLMICFILLGTMLLTTMQAAGELASLYATNGSFISHFTRFISPAWGFAAGWNYVFNWLIVLPFEITVACIALDFWSHAQTINSAVWVTMFLVALIIIQVFGVRGYGEVEFVLAIIKIIGCVGFAILAIIIATGGVPTDPRPALHTKYWRDPGAFRNGFKGFSSVFVTAAFAYGGIELSALAAAESKNPRRDIPKATKQVFWRIAFIYVLLLFLLTLVVSSSDDRLVNASGGNSKASPFVIAMVDANIKALPSIFNVIIVLAVISVANACAYGSTRSLQALAARGMAPSFFAKIDKQGRPIWCVLLQVLFGFLAYLNASVKKETVFSWLLAISGLASLIVWASICLAHIRFRAGWRNAGRSLEALPYRAAFGVWGSYYGLLLNILALAASFYSALFPPGSTGVSDAYGFFQAYLGAVVVVVFWLCWHLYYWLDSMGVFNPIYNKLRSRSSATNDPSASAVANGYSKRPRISHHHELNTRLFIRAREMDLDTGMRSTYDELLSSKVDHQPWTLQNMLNKIRRGLF